jgi:glucose-6-phosphate 1-epimerase
MELQALTDNFSIPGVLAFSTSAHGLLRAQVTSPSCTAEIYLQGAHITAWQPTGQKPVIFVSPRTPYEPDKPIRGGVPVIFPWFGGRTATPESPRTDGPQHGFARISVWELAFAAVSDGNLHLTFLLGPSETSRALGYDKFQVAYQIVLGQELRLRLTVANRAKTPLHFEEALHSYYAVSDPAKIALTGLGSTEYIDKVDDFKHKTQTEPILHLTGRTDRIYMNTKATVTLEDKPFQRKIIVAKSSSNSTVIWNPWSELTATMPDMAPDSWLHMTCIETTNVASNAVTLAPDQAHTMEAHVTLEPFA